MAHRSAAGGDNQGETLAAVVARGQSVVAARERIIEISAALAALFPERGLRRGSSVAVTPSSGGTTLALALVAAASRTGSWCAAVNLPALGLVAAAQLGARLDRLAIVSDPGDQLPVVTAALLDGVDVVLLGTGSRSRPADARRLVARARERGAVLITLGRDWVEGPDVRLVVTAAGWQGLSAGHGYLQSRQVEVAVTGRRAATRQRRHQLWLPGLDGLVAAAPAPVPALVAPVRSLAG